MCLYVWIRKKNDYSDQYMSLKSKIKKEEDWLCYGYAPVHVKLNFKEEIYKENSQNKCKYYNFTEI